ncbi:MAG: phenylalanine--tRNA ligase subunit beta [Bacteroidetes bacterium]|nr:phenylalanine--tRNA ligase subunit beta [Bacteroidota bacterium]
MNISYNWLSEYIRHSYSPQQLAVSLTSLGIEVEAIDEQGKRFEKIVTGEVLTVADHPNADKLHLTTVTIGSGEPLHIVCGAPNVRVGMKVAVATIGADLGEGFVIKKSKIRGEASEGMLCSARELGLSDDHSGLLDLPANTTIGLPFATVLGKTDTILEIGITPNRADCLSHIGIAREVAIATGSAVTRPQIDAALLHGSDTAVTSAVRVSIESPELCPRYIARIVRNVSVKESPEWLRRKLEAVGLRPRNNIVDITNFVLMECGHPLHAFDLSTVKDRHVIVRKAGGFAKTCTTLDSKERALDPDTLLIADAEKPLAIAGIMGGESSEITDATTEVLIESAYFAPSSIRRSAKLLGLSTDASYRFERGVDMENLRYAVDRAAALMAELGDGEVLDGVIDEYPMQIVSKRFAFRPARANMLLATSLDDRTIASHLRAVGFTIDQESSTTWMLTAPTWRVDLEQEVDAIEEIARIVGYDNLPTSREGRIPMQRERVILPKREFNTIVRNELVALGFFECISTPMYGARVAEQFHPRPVELMNPLTVELERMRTSIIGNLLDVCRRNERFGAEGQRLFEIGAVFHYTDTPQKVARIHESWEISIVLKDRLEQKSPYNTKEPVADIFSLRGAVEQFVRRLGISKISTIPLSEVKKLGDWSSAVSYFDPAQAVGVLIGRDIVGVAGKVGAGLVKEFDLRSAPFAATLSYDALLSIAGEARTKERTVTALPKYPAVERDIAVVVGREVTARALMDEVRSNIPAELLEDMRIFDAFESKEMKAEARKSLGVRLSLRSSERTLEDAEVDSIMASVTRHLHERIGATLRS